MDQFKPQVIKDNGKFGFGTMLVQLEKCPTCKKWMVSRGSNPHAIFPMYLPINFEAQLKAAGWVRRSLLTTDGEGNYLCVACAEANKAEFECALCGKRHTMDKIKEVFGDPPEFLCTECYTTVPAKVWDDKVTILEGAHRYDFS